MLGQALTVMASIGGSVISPLIDFREYKKYVTRMTHANGRVRMLEMSDSLYAMIRQITKHPIFVRLQRMFVS